MASRIRHGARREANVYIQTCMFTRRLMYIRLLMMINGSFLD